MTKKVEPDRDTEASARAAEIERRIEDWKARLPAHSLSPRMMAELDALEDELAAARNEAIRSPHVNADSPARENSTKS